MVKVWQPLEGTSHEDESVVDGYLELACSPAVLHSGRNKEFAMHLLYQLGGSVKVSGEKRGGGGGGGGWRERESGERGSGERGSGEREWRERGEEKEKERRVV